MYEARTKIMMTTAEFLQEQRSGALTSRALV